MFPSEKKFYKLTLQQRRRRMKIRGSIGLLVGIVIAGLLCFGDRMGIFGSGAGENDLKQYHNKTFLVVKTVDGDTIDIDVPDHKKRSAHTRIRLWGIDTPETVKPNHPVEHFGPEASRFTKTKALHQWVRIELLPHRTRDKYDRLLAYVYLPDGQMLNRELIALGLGYAYPYSDHPYDTEFEKLQRQARKNKVGLWKNIKYEELPWYMKKLR